MEPVSSELKAVGLYASLIMAAVQNQFSADLAQPVQISLAAGFTGF